VTNSSGNETLLKQLLDEDDDEGVGTDKDQEDDDQKRVTIPVASFEGYAQQQQVNVDKRLLGDPNLQEANETQEIKIFQQGASSSLIFIQKPDGQVLSLSRPIIGLPQQASLVEQKTSNEQEEPVRRYTRRNNPYHIKRPLNPFFVFAKEQRAKFSKERPDIHNAELSKILGEMWRSMGEEEKMPYIKEAERLSQVHKMMHPDYKYQPVKNPKKKPQVETKLMPTTRPKAVASISRPPSEASNASTSSKGSYSSKHAPGPSSAVTDSNLRTCLKIENNLVTVLDSDSRGSSSNLSPYRASPFSSPMVSAVLGTGKKVAKVRVEKRKLDEEGETESTSSISSYNSSLSSSVTKKLDFLSTCIDELEDESLASSLDQYDYWKITELQESNNPLST